MLRQVKNGDIEDIARLVKKAKKGDKKAFQLLYQEMWKPIYYMLLKKTGNESDAEVLLNEVFTSVFVSLKDLENEMAFVSWVTKIANNAYYTFLRNNERKEMEELYSSNEYIEKEQEYDEDFLPEAALAQKENRALVIKAVGGLPEKQREAIYMFYYLNMKTKEIAQATNSTEKTVTKRLHDAKKSLRNKLGDFVKKGVVVYNMAGFYVLRELFHEDIINTVNEKIGTRVWENISSSVAFRLAQKNAAAKAMKSLAVKFSASAAVAGIVAVVLWRPMGVNEAPPLPKPEPDEYSATQSVIPTESESAKDTLFNEISPTEMPLATTAPREDDPLSSQTNLEEPPVPSEIIDEIIDKIITEETPAPTEIIAEIITEQAPIPPSAEEIILPSQMKTPTPIETPTPTEPTRQTTDRINEQSASEVTGIMDVELVYEINEGPDEVGLIKAIAFYSGQVFEPESVRVLSNSFNGGRIGEYTIRLKVELGVGVSEIKATARVIDTISPNITVENSHIQLGEAVPPEEIIRLAGIRVEDNSLEGIIPTVSGYEKINFISNSKMEYVLIVNAQDSSGNAAVQKHIFITVE